MLEKQQLAITATETQGAEPNHDGKAHRRFPSVEAQPTFKGGQQHHSGAASANRFGQDRLLGDPTYSDKPMSADFKHSYVYAAASSSILLGTVALLQALAYSFFKYLEFNKLTTNHQHMKKINYKEIADKIAKGMEDFFWYKPTFASLISLALIIGGARLINKNNHHEQ